MHSFTYYQAAESFRDAERADSSFALPYWFEAFTHSHILWGEEDTTASYQVLSRLGATPEARLSKAATQLEALVARARGEKQLAMDRLRSAAVREDSLPPVGPPSWLIAHELLGARLSADGNSRDATAQYERALANIPNRSAALLGLARARAASADRAGARDAYSRLLENWRHADSDLPAPMEVRRGAMK